MDQEALNIKIKIFPAFKQTTAFFPSPPGGMICKNWCSMLKGPFARLIPQFGPTRPALCIVGSLCSRSFPPPGIHPLVGGAPVYKSVGKYKKEGYTEGKWRVYRGSIGK